MLRFLKEVKEGLNDIEELEESTALGSRTLHEIATKLEALEVLELDQKSLRLRAGGRVTVARCALEAGCSMQELSGCLDWREFEALAARALDSCGFRTTKNLRLTKPRRELDVVGVDGDFGVAFDCKHWRRLPASQMEAAARSQVERVRLLLMKGTFPQLETVMPAILVLFRPGFEMASDLAIVPDDAIFDFFLRARVSAGEFVTLRRDGAGSGHGGRQRSLF